MNSRGQAALATSALSGAILNVCGGCLFGTVRAAKKLCAHLYSVTDDLAVAVFTRWGNCLDRAFKAVERVSRPRSDDFETFVVFVTAHFAFCH
jgi:hypothetical protein